MYTIDEISVENQQDFFSRLYLFLAQQMLETCGRSGEGVVREAIRRFGAARGQALREKHIRSGLKANAQSYILASDSATDTRERGVLLKLSEEVCLREVYTCPRAHLWANYMAEDLGLWYCEEFDRARFLAYTGGVGQHNLSERLTCPRENHCRFSIYHRRANTAPEDIANSFSQDPISAELPEEIAAFHLSLGELCARLYCAVLAAARERFGAEGERAVATGLRQLAEDEAAFLVRKAEHTSNPCDTFFLNENFPLPLQAQNEPFLADCTDKSAARLLQVNLLDHMLAQPGIQV